MYKDFINWLIEEKHMGQKSAHDYSSRLKRVITFISTEQISDQTIDELDKNDSFKSLSMSVKSQMRRTVRLYLEFLNR